MKKDKKKMKMMKKQSKKKEEEEKKGKRRRRRKVKSKYGQYLYLRRQLGDRSPSEARLMAQALQQALKYTREEKHITQATSFQSSVSSPSLLSSPSFIFLLKL